MKKQHKKDIITLKCTRITTLQHDLQNAFSFKNKEKTNKEDWDNSV